MNNIDFSKFGYKKKNDFKGDLQRANVTEKEIATIIESAWACKAIEFRNDNKYDIKFQDSTDTFTVEVKEDFTCKRTGNIGVEYSCRGKDSGIRVSQADYYCYRAHTEDGTIDLLMETKNIKRLIENKVYHRTVNGGDTGSNSLNYLFHLSDIKSISTILKA